MDLLTELIRQIGHRVSRAYISIVIPSSELSLVLIRPNYFVTPFTDAVPQLQKLPSLKILWLGRLFLLHFGD